MRYFKNKKCYLLLMLVVSSIAVALIFSCVKTDKLKEIKIGAILPLTGDLSKFGDSFKKGIELALSENISNKKIKIIYEDDQGKPDVALSALRKLISFQKVPLIIGGVISSNAIAMSPVIDENKVVLISPTATAPELTKFKFFFRVQPSDLFEGTIIAKFATSDLNMPNIAVVYVNNDWGKGLADVFISEYTKAGGNITNIEYFERETNDFRTIISKVKSKSPQFVYLLGYKSELLNFLRQAVELGLDAKILSAYSFYDPDIIEKIPPHLLEGSYITAPLYDPDSSESIIKDFVKKYNGKFGQVPDMFAAHAYDCAKLVIEAIQHGNSTGESIAKYFHNIERFKGVTGKMQFTDGDVIKPYRILKVNDGKFDYLKTIEPFKK